MMKRTWLGFLGAFIGSALLSTEPALAQTTTPTAAPARPAKKRVVRKAAPGARTRTALPDSRIDNKVVVLREGKPMPLKTNVRWDFLEVAPGAKAFFAQVVVVPPPGARITEISGPNVVSKPGWLRADAALFALGSIS